MRHPQLAILGYSEAAMFLRGTPKPDVSAIISIHGAREFGVEADISHRLDLTFDDVEVATASDALAMQRVMGRKRWAEQNGLIEIAPTTDDVSRIIGFAQDVHSVNGIVLCHCGGGMSRAPAAGLICMSVWRGPGSEKDCIAEIQRLRRGAVPHVGLIRFADELLDRGGVLIDALTASGPG